MKYRTERLNRFSSAMHAITKFNVTKRLFGYIKTIDNFGDN